MTGKRKRWLALGAFALVLVALAALAWHRYGRSDAPPGLYSGNGRIEAVEIDVAAKTAGRVKEILVAEGEFVEAGQVLAQMDTAVLEAQRRQAEANLKEAQSAVATAQSQLRQREAELAAAEKRAARSAALAKQRAAGGDVLRHDRSRDLAAGRGPADRGDLSDRPLSHGGAGYLFERARLRRAPGVVRTARGRRAGVRGSRDGSAP
ncbi:MAG TPA: biotin/lipoyl-binding protein [Burkholderiales bacterium]